jgi:hypothetical protein
LLISAWRFLPRKRAGKVALVLLILNEIRGIVVVALVVGAWLHHR